MKALVYNGPEKIGYEDFRDPSLGDAREMLVRIDRCGICGSDLHIYHGNNPAPPEITRSNEPGYCVGHEAIGEVVEVGSEVHRFRSGDKVVLSGAVGCGRCLPCTSGQVTRCLNVVRCYGLGHALQGCQAQAVAVPAADFNAMKIPDGLTANQAIMLTDNLPTAFFGCRNADVVPGKTVGIVGLGPIGLMAVECAFTMGASSVFAIDPIVERRNVAKSLGAIALHPDEAAEYIREVTHGKMLDSAVEAVGLDKTVRMAIDLTGLAGTVSVIGVNLSSAFGFPMGQSFGRGLTFRIGGCSVQHFWPELVPLIQHGRLHPERFVTHELPMSQGAKAYQMFAGREQGALKFVMDPFR